MAELLTKHGFTVATVNRIISLWPDIQDLRERIIEIKENDPNVSMAKMFMLLTMNRAGGKSHASEKGDTGEPKKRGRGAAKPRPGR